MSFWDTVFSCAQVVGTSASVRPAAFQSAVLMNSARVEKSFGAQYSWSPTVNDFVNVG